MKTNRTTPITDPGPGTAPRILLHDRPFLSRQPWSEERPRTLVVACSDGRVQEQTDEFLTEQLGISQYDRLFAPGGPGALAPTTSNFVRGDWFRRECAFLVRAHMVEDVFLIFHGPSADGPAHATCADYTRRFSFLTPNEIRAQQQKDAAEIIRGGIALGITVRMHPYRCEVTADRRVQFVPLA